MSKLYTVATPVVESLTIEEALELIEQEVFTLIDSGEITFPDPEAASGHLDRSYYNNPRWLTEERSEIDIFAS